jgi:hypothetical protein
MGIMHAGFRRVKNKSRRASPAAFRDFKRSSGRSEPIAAAAFTMTSEHDPEKWVPVSRLREARFGGQRMVG